MDTIVRLIFSSTTDPYEAFFPDSQTEDYLQFHLFMTHDSLNKHVFNIIISRKKYAYKDLSYQ